MAVRVWSRILGSSSRLCQTCTEFDIWKSMDCITVSQSGARFQSRSIILRILHVVHRMHPPCFGGLPFYADRICQLHSERGHLVEAWTTLEGDRPKIEIRGGYLVRRFPALFSLFENPMTLSLLPQLIRYSSDNFDLVVLHSHLMFTSAFGAFKSRLSASPSVLISHGYSVRRGPFFNTVQQLYLSTVGRAIALNASHVVAMTHHEKKKLTSLGVAPETCTVVPPGVDSEFFRPKRRGPQRRLVTWIGRFVPEKNLTCLLRAFALLKQRRQRISMVLAGDGPERRKMMDFAKKLRLGNEVTFPGMISQREVADLLQRSTVFTLPSTAEALPFSLLESMSSGVPVIVSDGLGLDKVVGGAGLLANPRNPKEWAQSIESLISDDNLRMALGRRGRRLAVERYEWRRVADKLEELFLSLLESAHL
jgi:glycosyltransferase involved in cell wall biosynthesis